MKKTLLLTAVLLGAATASQAGVRFSFGIPFLAPPAVMIAPPAPVYVEPPQYVAPPVVCAPAPVVVAPPVIQFGFGGYHRPYYHDYHDYRAPYWHHDDHGRYHH